MQVGEGQQGLLEEGELLGEAAAGCCILDLQSRHIHPAHPASVIHNQPLHGAEAVRLALDGGTTIVQLREKRADGGPFLQQVRATGWVGTLAVTTCLNAGEAGPSSSRRIAVAWCAGRHDLAGARGSSWLSLPPLIVRCACRF